MEAILIVIGILILLGIIGFIFYALIYAIKIAFLIVAVLLLGAIGIVCGIVYGLIHSLLLFNVWFTAYFRHFHTAIRYANEQRNEIYELGYSGARRSEKSDENFDAIISDAFEGGNFFGRYISFGSFGNIIHLFGMLIYSVIYSIYFVIYISLCFCVGCVYSIAYTPYFYWKFFVVRRVFTSFSRARGALRSEARTVVPHHNIWEQAGLKALGYPMMVLFVYIHSVLFIIVFPFALTAFILVWSYERLYKLFFSTFAICPSCYIKMSFPSYMCGFCHKVHDDARPFFTHILYKKCNCSHKLPVSILSHRSTVNKCICTSCRTPIEAAENKPLCIPVIGGPSVGKTCFVTSTLNSYIEQMALPNSLQVKFASSSAAKQFKTLSDDMKKGILPPKTQRTKLFDMNLVISNGKFKVDRMLNIYDIAGENFGSSDKLAQYNYYGYSHGFVFLIDPFSIKAVAAEYRKQKDYKKVRTSITDLSDAFDILILNLEKYYGIKPDEIINKPCAVIINKLDAFDLNYRIGSVAISALIDSDQRLSRGEAENILCRKFLEDYGTAGFLMKLEHKFRHVQYFACSSISNTPDVKQKNIPGTLKSLTWILENVDKSLVR
ncbi:TRAFAC clade GTPase domain-containing protein [Paenibacillus cremeus]|uniref:Double-GTPase 2 domain-containing protein n=1 Tax=Paenibacillus cremeus TaxID=2163881 RepID=A0A559K8B6_9BACL|nr:hypothetical protein [Paenibacillus cremeus]TVY08367.1 hypothetical protein FPZ49_19180 [Paenibacillus cremeus]